MAELVASWWSWFAPVTLQATLLLGAAWIVDRALRKHAWPQLLTTLWLVALARLVVPPTLASPWSVTTSLGAPTIQAARSGASQPYLAWLAALWLLGASVCLAGRQLRRRTLARRIVGLEAGLHASWRAALEVAASSMRMERAPRLGTLDGLRTPAVSGLLRPTLLLPPASLGRAPTRHDRIALLHELAHIRRRDLWLDEACELVRGLFWFHPLVWVAVARIRAWSEVACDETVVRQLGQGAREVRDTLVLAARDTIGLEARFGVRAFLGRASATLARIEHLDQVTRPPIAVVRAASATLALVLFACILPMAPASATWRASAQHVLDAQHVIDAQRGGERQSCFTLHAAALVLAADPSVSPIPPRD